MFSFGGQQQQQQPTSNLFGQPASPSPFGVAPPLPGAPSGAGLFGQPSPSPGTTSLFGAAPAAQQSGGLFGQTTTSPATGGLFGQQPAATGLSGASPFGQPAAAASPSPFGQPAGGGLFGAASSTTVSPTPTAFGASPFGAAPMGGANGTAVQKYQTTRDQELNMKLVSITAMDCYKSKSLEELRWEDIQAGRGQPGAQPATTPSTTAAWGAPVQSQPAATGLFGSTAPASGGLFGQTSTPAPASGGLFGTPSTATGGGLFGQTSTGAPSGGLFGQQAVAATPTGASGGLFGQPTSGTTSGGLFGSTPAQPAAAGGGLFGSTPSAGGLFGTPAAAPAQTATTGGLFGSATQPATGGLFGSTPAAAPAASGGLFGSSTTATASGGLFGSSAAAQPASTGGGLFGSSISTAQPAVAGGGLFGSTTTQPATSGGLFGSTTGTTTTPSTGGGLFGTSTTPSTTGGGLFGSSTGGGLFGTSTTTPAAGASTGGGLFGTSSTTPSTTTGGLFGTTTTPTAPGGGLFGTSSSSLFGGPSTAAALPAPSGGGLFGSLGTTTTTPPAATGTGLGFAQGGLFGSAVGVATQPAAGASVAPPPVPRPSGLVAPKPVDKDSLSAFLWKDKTGESTTPLIKKKSVSGPPSPKTFVPKPSDDEENKPTETPKGYVAAALADNGETPLRISTGSPKAPIVKPKIIYTTPTKDAAPKNVTSASVLPVCANHNLWTKPSIEAMGGMTEHELSRIEHFQIGHYGVGSVTWPGLTDVRFLVIDDIIVFKKGSVTLFPDEELKPPVGTGLNKTAIIELIVKPKNLELAKKYESRYVDEMKKLTESNGAEFLSYDLESWRFRVEHFSTWGIDESQWLKIDLHLDDHRPAPAGGFQNDLSLFSRIEQELGNRAEQSLNPFQEDEDEDEWIHEGMEVEDARNTSEPVSFRKEDFVGALAVAPPTREELKQMGWDLKLLDLFQNQSFRVTQGLEGFCFLPEHPVIDDLHRVSKVTGVTESVSSETASEIESLVLTLAENRAKKSWTDLIDAMESTIRSGKHSGSFKSVFSLMKALFDNMSQVDGDISPSGREPINTAALNEWLSKINAEWIRASPNLAFSPAAAMCSRHYSPTATELLVSSGYPRLALATAAGIDHNSRRLMEAQLGQVKDSDKSLQQVADILGGNSHKVSGLNWRADLALRYWYTEHGDLNGFEPPASSLEWRLIKTVVLSNSSEILQLKEQLKSGTEAFLLFVVVYLLKLRKNSLVQDSDLHKVVISCSDFILNHPRELNWQLSPIILSFLPDSAQKTMLIDDVVSRNIDKDVSLIEKLGLVDHKMLVSAKAVHALSEGRTDIAKTLLVAEGMSKAASGLVDSIPAADSKL